MGPRYCFSSPADADAFQQRFGGRRQTVRFMGNSTRPIDEFADEKPRRGPLAAAGMVAATALLLSLAGPSATMAFPVRVVDGDTFTLAGEVIRIENIDAPEIHEPKCPAERALGKIAKRRLDELLNAAPSIDLIRRKRLDRYGRTIALVRVDGSDLGEQLIVEGLARRWSGKRRPWC